MTRAELAQRANAAAVESRRGGAPALREDSDSETIAAWLQWCDPNGVHTAELATAEGGDPYSVADAWDAVAGMLGVEAPTKAYVWEGALWCRACVRPLMARLLLETPNDFESSSPAEWPQPYAAGGTCEGCGAVVSPSGESSS